MSTPNMKRSKTTSNDVPRGAAGPLPSFSPLARLGAKREVLFHFPLNPVCSPMRSFSALVFLLVMFFVSCAPAPQKPQPPVPTTPPVAESPETMAANADSLAEEGKKTKALEVYEAFLDHYPNHSLAPQVLLSEMRIYDSLQEYDALSRAGNRFLTDYQQSPLLVEACLLYSRALVLTGNTAGAKSLLSQIETRVVSPGDRAGIQVAWALVDEREGRLSSALQRLAAAYDLSVAPYREVSKERTLELLTLMSAEELEAARNTYANRFPENIILLELGRRYTATKQYGKAETAYSGLVSRYPRSEEAAAARTQLESIHGQLKVDPKAVGCILPLSGPNEAYGQRILFGLMLGLGAYSESEQPSSFRLVIKDSKGSPTTAEQCVRDLVSQDKVGSIIGPLLSNTAKAAAQEAQKLNVPIITLTQSEEISSIGDFVFRNFITAQMQVRSVLDYAMKRREITRFAVLYPESEYGNLYAKLFTEEVVKMGGAVTTSISYPPDTTDFRDSFRKLLGVKARAEEAKDETPITPAFQGLFIPDDYRKILMIAPQVAYFNVENVTLLGTILWNYPELAEKGDRYIQGALFPAAFHMGSQTPENEAFRSQFKTVFSQTPDLFSAIGYDTAKMIVQAVTGNNAWTREEIRNAIAGIHDYPGVTGITSFRPDGDVDKQLLVLTVVGDSIMAAP